MVMILDKMKNKALLYPNLRVRGPVTLRLTVAELSIRPTRTDRTKNSVRTEPDIAAVSSAAICLHWSPGPVLYTSTVPDSSATVGARLAVVEKNRRTKEAVYDNS